MELLGSAKSKITEDKSGENLSHLEFTKVVLFHYNIVNNNYQQNSSVLHTFVSSKLLGQLLDISPKNLYF